MQDSLLQSVLNTQNINKAILLVEDSDEDFAAFSRMLWEAAFFNPVYRTCDGDDALDYLYHQGEYADPATSPRPAIILIDLNLPGTDGREVIEQVKQDEALKSIPIVVFTTSSSPKDIKSCYQYGVNCYMLKPIGVEALRKTVRIFLDYWFKTAVLPNSTQ
ncbi:response regulator [Scytonema sp. PCC 10023]|uniref:response regulator n=1 Tax=Scytonema sp. PCC 10023 TaxID=1680591 RepID=UPI0039C62423